MVRITVLGSGSRGNSTLLSAGEISILIDAGLSCREIIRRFRLAGEDIRRLSAILITHEHQDHVQGLGVLARKLQIPVYMTGATHRAWEKWVRPNSKMTYAKWISMKAATSGQKTATTAATVAVTEAEPMAEDLTEAAADLAYDMASGAAFETPCDATEPMDADSDSAQLELEGAAGRIKDPAELPALERFASGVTFHIGPVKVNPFTIPHDATDPVGFVFQAEDIRIAVVTDLGYVPDSVRNHLRGCDCLMIESNHDLEMLRYGPYPWSVKQRVMSRVGHLSNDALAKFLAKDYDGNASFVILAHISESNNHPELARTSAEQALGDRQNLLGNHLVLAKQNEPLEPICF